MRFSATGPKPSTACLAVDVEQSTVSGYEISSSEYGYGDFALIPDLATLRLVPWKDRAAMVECDAAWPDGSPVRVSPRQVLKEQVRRLAEHDLIAFVGTELEFMAFNTSFQNASTCQYRNLVPVNEYNVDYSLLGMDQCGDAARRYQAWHGGCQPVRGAAVKGECNLGQHEIAFRYADALTTCDNHVVYENDRRGDRGRARPEHHVHAKVQWPRGQLLPYPYQPK